MESLARKHAICFEREHGLLAFGVTPAFSINQRALLLPTALGNVMWECVSLVTEHAVAELKKHGGVAAIVISHPHFYSSMVEWSEALGGVPVYLHQADRAWVQRPSPNLRFWSDERIPLSNDVTLLRLGGHFEGSTGLHWIGEHCPKGVLFPGDAIQVTMDRRNVTFMYSFPNYIPMTRSDVMRIGQVVSALEYDSIFGFTWGRNIIGNAKDAVDRSLHRFMNQYDH